MNKIFKVIWSKSKQCYIVVSEMAKNHSGKKKIVVASILAAMAVGSETAVVEVQAGAFDGGQIGSYYATAIGYKANAFTDSSIAIGTYSYSKGTQVPGDAGSTVDPSIAIGNKARAVGNSALAVGMNATADNSFGVAVGRNTEVTGDYGVGIGFKSKAALHGIGIGEQARALKEGATTLGVSSRGYGKGAIAIGWQSLAGADVYTAGVPGNDINKDSSSKIDGYNNWGDMSVGLRALATGGNATALGRNAAATAANAVAIGGGNGNSFNDNTERTQASGVKSTAIGYNSTASGTSAATLGTKASASAENAAAIGTSASASAKDTFAAGSSAAATAEGATAVGKAAKAQKADATSLGSGAIASEVNATALGKGATASKGDATAVGSGAQATEANAVAIGKDAEASKGNAIAIGKEAEASEASATAIGDGANAEKADALAIGTGAISGGTSAIAVGKGATAQATEAVAVGVSTEAKQDRDSAFGNAAKANGGGATAVGYLVNATGNQSFSAGSNTAVSGSAAVGIGYKVTASGDRSISIGNNDGNNTTSATGSYTVAIGSGTTAGGSGAVAIGKNVQNTKDYTTAIGLNLTASESATASVLLGYNSTTQGNQSVNIGSTNTTEKAAQYSTAIGYKAKVGGKNAIAIGSNPDTGNELIASATNSVAIGTSAQAKAEGATALGYGAGATSSNSLAFGTSASSSAEKAVALGNSATATANSAVAIGDSAQSKANHSVAIGTNAKVLAGQGNVALGWGTEIGNDDVSLSNKVPDAQKTYAYLLDKSSEDAANDAGNGIVAIGKKRSTGDGQTIARRLTGVAGGVNDYDAVNLKQVKALESNERHIKAKMGNDAYRPDATGKITLNYVNGKGADVTGETAEITDVAKKSDEWMLRTQNGTITADATPQTISGVSKKAVTLKAGDNIAIENSNGTVTIKAKDVVTSITSGNTTALTVNPSKGAVTITPNIASAVGANGEDGKLVTSGIVKTALDAKIDKTAEMHIKTGEYTVDANGIASLIQQNGNNQDQSTRVTIKDIAKKSVVDGINTTVNTHTTQIASLTSEVGGKVSQSDFDTFKAKTITFTGDDNAGVARALDTALTVKGGANYTSTTANTNIRVEKDGSTGAAGLLVKLSDKLTGMKEIAGDGKTDLVIKNGTNTVTITPGKTGDNGTVNFGDAKVVASNLEADITYRANGVADTAANTVKLKKGLNFTAATDTNTTTDGPKSGLSITTGADGLVTFGLDKATRSKIDNAADKNLSNLSDDGKGKVTELAKAAAKEAVKVAPGINTTVDTDTTTTVGVTMYKVNANDTTVAVTGDGLSISGGDLGATNRVRAYTLDLSAATKGKLTAVGNLAGVIGGTTIAADGTVTGPTFNITKAEGGTETANTLKDAIDKLNATNAGQNTKISETAGKVGTLETNVTNLGNTVTNLGNTVTNLGNTVTSNYNDLSNKITQAGTNVTTTLTTKGLDFTGNDTTAKVHRDLGTALTIQGAENFTRAATETNNIKVVKNNDALDVKLAENLGNIKEIAGDGTHDLVIKNGDTKVTVKAPKDGDKGSIDFGDTKLVASNLDASIKYRANDDAVGNAKSVKLADGFNYVASKDVTTTAEGPKSGLVIKAEDNGKVTFGLDKATREKVDNAADKNLSNLSDDGKDKVKELAKTAAQDAVKVAPGINTTVDTDTTTTAGVTTYKVNANDTTVAVSGTELTIDGGTPDPTTKIRAYTLGLSDATKGKLAAVGNLATVIGGTTIAENGTVTGPTFTITKADGNTETAKTLKDAIEKLDAANKDQNTNITNLGTRITNLVDGGMTFIGDDATADKVTRKLGETLNIHGQNNITVKKDGTDATTLNVKLASELKNITSITNADGDGKPGSKITLGTDGVSIANTAAGQDGAAGETKTVTIGKDGINAGSMKITNVAEATANGDATNKQYVDTAISNAVNNANTSIGNKGLDFYGNKDSADTDKIHRNLGEALKVKGAENFTREATATNNIDVVKNATGDGLDVKLAENLGNIKEIAGDGTHDLVIKNGDTKITVEAPKDGNKGVVDLGDTKLKVSDLDANISYKAGTETVKNKVKLQDGFNFVAGTGTVAPKHLEAGTTSPTANTDSTVPKKGIAISTAANGVVNIGLDSDTRGAIDNAANKDLSNLTQTGKDQVTTLAKTAAKEVVKVANGINTTVDTDTTTTEGVTVYKVNAIDTTVAVGSDALTINNATPDTNKVRAYSVDLSDATKGKLAAVGNLATVIGGTTIAADGSVTGPTFTITKADGNTETAKTLKDAIEKLDAANAGQNTAITNLGTRIDNLVDGGMTFIGDDATADKVTRKLGETLNIHGQNNITVKKDGTDATTLNVKLASELKNITSITNADADGKLGSKITLGADGVSITNTAAGQDGAAGEIKTVTIGKDGINAGGMKITNVAEATADGDAANKQYVDTAISNLNTKVTNNANLNFAGNVTKNAQDADVDRVGLALATGTLHVKGLANEITTTAKGDTITVELAQTVKDQLAKVGDTASNGRDGANGLTGKDGLNDKTVSEKVNALRNGEAGTVVYTDDAGERLVKANDGKYYHKDDLKDDGTPKTADENNGTAPKAVDNPQARVVNANGDVKTATTLSNIAEGKVVAGSKEAVNGGQLHTVKSDLATALGGDSKVNADGSFTGPTYNITKDDGSNTTEEAKSVGDAISKLDTRINNANTNLGNKGLDFYGNKDAADTDKVHRNLGEALKVKGAENFTRADGATNNIDVVKNAAGDGLDVKLAENLGNIKEIAGDGTHDLVIKNGDTKITVEAPKDGNKGVVDLGDTKLKVSDLDANISYKAGTETVKNKVKLQDGFNFVAGTGTVAPKHLEVGTTSPTATTDSAEPKKGIAISTADNGVVNIGLDSDTRGAIDNAADKDLSNLTQAGKDQVTTLAKTAAKEVVKVADGINTTVTTDTTTTEGVTVYKVNAIDTTVAVGSDALTINNATPDTNKVRAYTVDLSDATKGKLAAVGNLANVIGGTTIAADGTVTGPTFNITKADGTSVNATTLKDAIEKLDAANKDQNTNITNLDTRIDNLVDGGMTFIGDDATADTVTRKLGETLNIHGQNNISVKKAANSKDTLNVTLASELKNITSITNADADGKPGSKITLGADGVSIANTAAGQDGAAGETKTVTIGKDGINAGSMKITNVAEATEKGDATNKQYVDTAISNLKDTVTKNANLRYAGDTNEGADADKTYLNLPLATDTLKIAGTSGEIKTVAKAGTITLSLEKTVTDKLAQLGDTTSNGRDGANGLTGADGQNGKTVSEKVNALRNGEAGTVVYTDDAGERLVKANDGKYYHKDALKADGTPKTADENNGTAPKAVDNPQARVVNANGDAKTATTLSNIADGKVVAGSKEAVNGGQLHTVKSDLATALGGDSKVNADGSFTGPTYNITKDDGSNTTEEAKSVGDAISKLDTRINNANASLGNKGLDFYGNKDTADTDKVHRNLGEALKVKGAENFTREATATNNIDVVKNAAGDGLDVKLAENLGNIKEIAGDGSNDLVIKNGDTKVTVKAPKDGNTGSIDFGDTKLIANNLEADITYRANSVSDAEAKSVKLQKGLNFVASDVATTTEDGPKSGLVIKAEDDGKVTFGLDKATREKVDNAADKNLSNLSEAGNNKISNLAKAAAKETVKVANGINTTVDTDTTTTEGVTTYKVNANDTKVAIAGDGLTISGGDLGATDRVRTYTLDLSDATKGKLAAVGNLANVIGGTTIAADGTVTGPTFNITKADGTGENANTLKEAIEKLDAANQGQNEKITNLGNSITEKGLDFYGNKDAANTDKIHRNLGEALKVKGAENFTREATATNNIDVVKNAAGDGLDVKLAENLGNIKEIAGDGNTDLVIKNGDASITLKPAKPAVNDPATGDETTPAKPATVDFGDSNVVAKNLDASITYRANNDTDENAKSVKLKQGLNFVAGTGTVAPKHIEAGTPSPSANTDSVATKKGIVISTEDNGVVNIGLDSDTRSAIDNAANQDLSNLTTAGKQVIIDAAQGAVKVAAGNNVTIDPTTKDNVTTYTVNGRDTTVKAATGGSVSVTGGDLNAKGEREYTVDLTDAAKAEINRIAGIDTRLTTAEGNITTLQGDMTKAKADIAGNTQAINTNKQEMAKNAQNIAKNAGDIATNAGNIATNTANITKNAGDIATNAGNIKTNADNITTNAAAIAKNAGDIKNLQGNSATKDLSNLTNAGKDVVTGLVNVVGTNGITVTSDTDTTSRVKTFTAKLDDKVTFGKEGNKITIDGTTGTVTAPNASINVVNTNTVQVGDANKTNTAVTPEGVTVTTKQPDGTVTSTVIIKEGTVSGLTNTKWDPTKVTDADRSKAATQGQVKDVSDTLQKGRVFAADTGVASTTVALGDTLAIKGGAKGLMTDNNIGVELSAGTDKTPATMTVRLAKNVQMKDGSTSYDHYMDINGKPVQVATTTVDGTGVTIAPVKALNKPSVSLTADGLDNGGNAIHHVAPGTAADDAATLGQVVAAASTVSRQVNQTGAHAAALAAMNPLSYDPLKKSQVMAGYGAYKGNSALALGVAHYANEDTLFNVGVSVGNGENMVNAGMTYRFGGEDSMIPERYKGGPISSVYVMQDEITALKAENARKDAENARKDAENEEMKAQIKMLIERVTMLEAKK